MRLWIDSNKIKKGDIFLVNDKNKKYVSDAIDNKASLIITETNDEFDIETKHVKSIYDYIKEYYEEKIKDIKLIGITGTNGKTTTCYLIYQILNMIGVKTAYIGTIGFYLDDNVISLNNTTPSIDILYNLIMDAKDKNCKVVVMEVSSHALKQDRVHGLLFDAIAVTNITQDHLDYHLTMGDYIKSKKKIIHMTKNNKICILNKKGKRYKRFINNDNNNFIIGKDIKINLVINDLNGTKIIIKDDINKCFNIPLVGMFNVYNFLYAYYIIKKLGYNVNCIKDKLYLLSEPPGRMQKINYKNNVIFVDYAHTPDAVKKVLKTIKKIKNNGIITIVGCGGNRDKTKRPIMAKIACKYSSYVIFTNDNPRKENEQEIMKDILKGASGKYEVIYDRGDAIKRGIELLDNNMILMVLGKGHEDYQIIEDKKLHFSDVEVINDIISYKKTLFH